jgi:hypothetical protein
MNGKGNKLEAFIPLHTAISLCMFASEHRQKAEKARNRFTYTMCVCYIAFSLLRSFTLAFRAQCYMQPTQNT